MISRESISNIIDTARIEDVVGDFVTLKKRGANLLGLCPFHNEKTPSFTVSPSKGIYKCFGCGKAGNSINFIMEVEHYTYPEALRFLAKKYQIQIQEDIPTAEDLEQQEEKESLYTVTNFALNYFIKTLFETDEGKAIGLTYLIERGFTETTIQKFQLGYSLSGWSDFTEHALKNGYSDKFLRDAGLTTGENKQIDFFRGRVIFPIHNLTGKAIAFGGRILKKDEKAAKYLNSKESVIYEKSRVLYGIYFARKKIAEKDMCYLTEGYTDVISMHQAGVENTVASAGTSLTIEQIRLIRRFTNNITLLYDADPAGIKASGRGVEMILEEGMNVKVVLFPPGEDPDSYSRSVSNTVLANYLNENSQDFIMFKTGLLMKEIAGDPIKKAGLIRDIMGIIAKIPDAIIRSEYTKECSRILDTDENILISELRNKRAHFDKLSDRTSAGSTSEREFAKQTVRSEKSGEHGYTLQQPTQTSQRTRYEEPEREIIRILLAYGNKEYSYTVHDEEKNRKDLKAKTALIKSVTVITAQFILDEIIKEANFLQFENPLYKKIFQEFVTHYQRGVILETNYFIQHHDPEIVKLTVDLVTFPHIYSENWMKMHQIPDRSEEGSLRSISLYALNKLKMANVVKMEVKSLQKIMEVTDPEEEAELKEFHRQLLAIKKQLANELSSIIT